MDTRLVNLARKLSFAATAKAMFEEMFLRDLRRTDSAHPLRQGNIEIGSVAYGSLGTSAVSVAGSIYIAELFLRRSMLVTGIALLNGTIVGTDTVIYALYDALGRRLANTTLAGVTSAGADAFQEIALTIPYDLRSDGRYWLALQVSGATATHRRMAASTFLNRATSQTGAFGTIPGAIAPPTSFTAGTGPIGYVY
jgi:hypothetical protein